MDIEFPPASLRNYALIADGERGALCGPRGELAWLCAPRWHDDPVFATLIGGGGVYAVTPAGRFVWGGDYRTGTLIWRNRWPTDTSAIVTCVDALAMPADPARVVILRRMESEHGEVRVHIVLDVRAGFGHQPMRELRNSDGVWTGRSGSLQLRWSGGDEARVDDQGRLVLDLTVRPGERHDLVLEIGEHLGEPVVADQAWRRTEEAWRAEAPPIDGVVAERDARHASAVLRGLTSASGGMVAAATMSLPERADENRSYDYRYAWIRDQCYAGLALASAGVHSLLNSAVEFVTARLIDDGPQLRPAYLVTGDDLPDEQPLDLPGYPGGSDVRGNAVTRQFQLDAFGETLQLFAAAGERDLLTPDAWRAAQIAADSIEQRWLEPDAGVWELSDEWWTHSRLACVSGLRAAAQIAPRRDAERMRSLADTILAETTRRCVHPDGFWQRSPDDKRVDAALLLPAVRGATARNEPLALATIEAVRRDLLVDGYLYRYREEGVPLGAAEGAFVLCGFLLALAESHRGNAVAAFRAFERNRAACGPPGLLAEEFDVEQRQLRGNLPQAFVHAALLECCVRLSSSDWGAP